MTDVNIPKELSRIKVTVSDPDTGEVLEEKIINNEYTVVCAGNRYIKSMQQWGSTHQLNIAVNKNWPAPA